MVGTLPLVGPPPLGPHEDTRERFPIATWCLARCRCPHVTPRSLPAAGGLIPEPPGHPSFN